MLQNARAVYIVPKLIKGGFIFGAEGGDGVLLHRVGHELVQPEILWHGFGLVWPAGWPAAGGTGLHHQFRALRGIEKGEVKLGAGAGITVVTLSSGAEGATTSHGGDIVVWASGTGAYAGLTFNGSGDQGRQGRRRHPRHRPGSAGPAPQSGLRLVETEPVLKGLRQTNPDTLSWGVR